MELLERHFDRALETPEGIKKLRELIILLAMKGKLVRQDFNDQPASELLKQFEAEKLKMFEEGKIRKQEQLPLITQVEIPYELPDNWKWVRLGDVGETNIGLTYSPKDISDIGIPVLRSNNIQKGILDLSNLVRVNKEVKSNVLVSDGDLLICVRNGSKSLVGKTAQINGLNEKMAFGAFMAIFRSRINDYVLYFINSLLFREMIDDVNTTTINQITQNNLKTTIFPLPPLAEQKRIVMKIHELMALCDKLEAERNERDNSKIKIHSTAMNRLLSAPDSSAFNSSWSFITKHFSELYSVTQNVDELKKSILQLAVMGKLVPQDVNDQPASELLKEIEAEKQRLVKEGMIKKQEAMLPINPNGIPYELPVGWQWVMLGTIISDTITGIDRGKPFQSDSNKYPYFKMNNISNQGECDFTSITRINYDSDDLEKYILNEGDFLFNTRNSLELVGKTCIFKKPNNEQWLFNNNILRINFLKDLNKKYINIWFLSPAGKRELEKIKSSTTNVAAIYQGKLNTYFIPIPPSDEQKRIIKKIDQLMELCNSLEQRIKDSTEKKSEILEAVLSRV